MKPSRCLAWTLLTLAGFALLNGRVLAQPDPPLPAKNDSAFTDANNIYKLPRGLPPTELATARPKLKAVADYFAAVLAHPLVHRAPQDPSLKVDASGNKLDANNKVIPTVDGLLKELDRLILEPNPLVPTSFENKSPKVNYEQVEYIRELGAALDAALKPLIDSNPDRAVKVNAARVYASACRSGAAPHWPTVTAWLTNANTPAEVKYYALQAAANLLSAHDVNDYKSRRHALDKNPRSEADKEIAQLVVALQNCIEDPNLILPGLPGGKITDATLDQVAVVGFIRRQAVRALGQVRFAAMPGPDGKTYIYPAYTLARVCLSDATLYPQPSTSECAEAAIGLCNMAPSWNGNPIKAFNPSAACEAVTAAVITFAAPRSSDPTDRSLPWRGYSLRLNEALKNWPPLFDPSLEATNPSNYNRKDVPQVVTDTITNIQTLVLAPIDKVNAAGQPDLSSPVQLEKLRGTLRTLRDNPARSPLLFSNVPGSTVDVPQKK